MKALFDGDYSGLGDGATSTDFDPIYTAYIDKSGIGLNKEFDLLRGMHNIKVRQRFVKTQVFLQRECMFKIGEPFWPSVKDLSGYGHRLTFDKEKPGMFLMQVDRVEIREKKYQAELDAKEKELEQLKKYGVDKQSDTKGDFLRMLNRLNQAGYKIVKTETDVEELAYMIRMYDEDIKAKANDTRPKYE